MTQSLRFTRTLGAAAVLSATLLMGAPAMAAGDNAAVVNGKAIPASRVDEFVKILAQQGRPDTPETRKMIRDELITRELFVQEADKRGLEKSADVQQQLQQLRQEAEAKDIIAKLKKGEGFESLAKLSKDPGSGANGGDLGWNTPDTFVKEFSEAMTHLKKGEYTVIPVKTQFGYHIIQLDDVRAAEPPPFDQVKPQLKQQLERQKIQALQESLKSKAKIEE